MLETLKPKFIERRAKIFVDGVKPIKIEWNGKGEPAKIYLSNKDECFGTCIRCYDTPCIEYNPKEIEIASISNFPSDKNTSVCPTTALSLPNDSEIPVVNNDLCIKCGLCVNRCPVKAISLNENGIKIQDEPNKYFKIADITSKGITDLTVSKFIVQENGLYYNDLNFMLKDFLKKNTDIFSRQSTQFPNHLVRNLLINCGINSAMRRRGDTNVRMDIIFGISTKVIGTGEVELGLGVIDAPRNILDNIAILISRYNFDKSNIIPLIICNELPNKRSEFWQFINDIKKVLNISINTMTISGLLLLSWTRQKLLFRKNNEYYIDIDNTSLKKIFESLHNIRINDDIAAGILDCRK